MRMILMFLLLSPFAATAETPRVVTDVMPIQSLVAQVMGGLGEPDVLVSGAASPHDFQFTFAQADAVQNADLVIWMGAELTPWLEESLTTLAPNAPTVALLHTDGWEVLELRDWEDDHDHDHDHAHDEDHDRAAIDPHAWLDPTAAAVWVQVIADELTKLDPDNADTYQANAQAAAARLDTLNQEITAQLADVPRAPLLVPHDAYHYFGHRYDVEALGTISLSDATTPSPDAIAALQNLVREDNVQCVLSDPQSRTAWIDLVREGSTTRTAFADPLGTNIAPGPDHYAATLREVSAAYVACLGG